MIAAVKKILSVAEAGGVPPDNAAELFELYIDSILAGEERLHLFSRSELTPRRVTDHHILDAVAALHFARPKKGARLLDYGAGSGVVGITWKILRPDLQLVLLESMKRKASFLKGALRVLDLEGAEVWTGRGEDFARSDPATIDFLVSRGVFLQGPGDGRRNRPPDQGRQGAFPAAGRDDNALRRQGANPRAGVEGSHRKISPRVAGGAWAGEPPRRVAPVLFGAPRYLAPVLFGAPRYLAPAGPQNSRSENSAGPPACVSFTLRGGSPAHAPYPPGADFTPPDTFYVVWLCYNRYRLTARPANRGRPR